MFSDKNLASIDQVIALVKQIIKPDTGRTSFVVTAKGDEVKTAFKVVEASSLIVSNNGDGTINPAYPAELQPRDRTRLSSKMQVNNIAKSIRPAQLGDSGMSSHGAPIIGPDNVVESGNGRTMGLLRAYGSGQADGYRAYLVENAKLYGLTSRKVEAMRQPVLVRVRLDDVDRVKFAKDSNISDLQEMAASEKAFVDADSIDGNLLAQFNPGDSGDLLAKSNRAFLQGFMKEIGATAAAGLMTEDGRPTRQLVDRVQNAIFAKAYKNERLVKLVAEEPDPELRNVLTALNVAAPDFVEMQYLSGEAHKSTVGELVEGIEAADTLDAQAMKSLIEAIGLVREAKESGQHINEVIAQQGLFGGNSPEGESLALFIVSNNRSAKRMARAFKLLAQKINDELIHQQQAAGDMFGGETVTLPDVLKSVSSELENEFGEGATLGLFEAAPVRDKSTYFPEAENVDDLRNLIEAKLTGSSGPLGTLVGRYLNDLLDNKITQRQYVDKVKAVIGEGSELWKAVAEGTDGQFARNVGHEVYSAGIATGLRIAVIATHIILRGNVDNVRQLWLDYSAIPESDRQARTEAAKKLYTVYLNAQTLWGGHIPVTMFVWWEHATRGMLHSGDWQTIIDLAENKIPLISKTALPMVMKQASESGAEMLAASTPVMKVRSGLKASAERLEETLLKAGYIHQNLQNNLTVGALTAYVRRVVKPLSEGRMRYADSKASGYAVAMRNLSVSGREALQEEIYKTSLPVVNRIHAVTDILTADQPAQDEEIDTLFNGVQIDPALKQKWEAQHNITIEKVIKTAFRLAGGKISTLKYIQQAPKGERASANAFYKRIFLDVRDGPDVLMHEIGHHFEFSNKNLAPMAAEFLRSRAKSRTLGKLETMTAGVKYKEHEKAVRDNFSEPYIGKVYGSWDEISATEVFSMGFQYLWDAAAGAVSMVNKDGLLEFVTGAIKGVHNSEY